jgi:hypothetical protein
MDFSFRVVIHGVKHVAARVLFLGMVGCTFADCVALVRAQEQRKPELVKPENIQGCYELTLSAWRPNLNLGEDVVFVTPPHRIHLFAERGTQGWESEGYVVKPAPGVAPSLHRGSYWSPKNPQSIEIVWTTGFSGLAMILKIEGTDLRGEARSFWDFPRRQQKADVTARKVECQTVDTSAAPRQVDCQVAEGQPKIVPGEGWGVSHCCEPEPEKLSRSKVKALVKQTDPIHAPCCADMLHISGTIALAISVDPQGNAVCVQTVSGNPLIIGVAIDSVRQWKFEPYICQGVKKPFCGQVELRFQANEYGVKYKII